MTEFGILIYSMAFLFSTGKCPTTHERQEEIFSFSEICSYLLDFTLFLSLSGYTICPFYNQIGKILIDPNCFYSTGIDSHMATL